MILCTIYLVTFFTGITILVSVRYRSCYTTLLLYVLYLLLRYRVVIQLYLYRVVVRVVPVTHVQSCYTTLLLSGSDLRVGWLLSPVVSHGNFVLSDPRKRSVNSIV